MITGMKRGKKEALYKKASKKLKACQKCHTIHMQFENYCYNCHSNKFITEENEITQILFGYFEERVLI